MSALRMLAAFAVAMLAGGYLAAQESPPGQPILPGTRTPDRPVPLTSGLPPVVYPFPSLQLLIGSDFLEAESSDPDFKTNPGTPFSTGAVLGLSWVGEFWRFGYSRRVYRHALPADSVFRGTSVDFLAVDADALAAHGGFRPRKTLYLGAGLSAQRRRLEFLPSDSETGGGHGVTESVLAGEALFETSFALPFAFQARYTRDLTGPRVEMNGWTLLIAYTVPL